MKTKSLILISGLLPLFSNCIDVNIDQRPLPDYIKTLEKESIRRKKDSTYVLNESTLANFYERRSDELISNPEYKLSDLRYAALHYRNVINNYNVSPEWLMNKGIFISDIENKLKVIQSLSIPTTKKIIKESKDAKRRDKWYDNIRKNTPKKIFPKR